MVFWQACAVKQTAQQFKVVSYQQIEELKLGSTKSEVLKILGDSYRVSPPVDKSDYEGWIYDGPNGYQRAAAVFDSSGTVIVKVFMPVENEPDEKLNFWLKEKFAQFKFEEIASQRCHRDFIPAEIYYINSQHGIVIEFNRHYKYVESVKWMSSLQAQELGNKTKFCK